MNSFLALLLAMSPIAAVQSCPQYSQRQHEFFTLAQVPATGSRCQTRFGICPIIDFNGVAIALPLGSPCGCGNDPGFVIQ